jgi:2',3'-cyclic-nucleotide 2'-phosphodiesterase (5'-nucleotidase family)
VIFHTSDIHGYVKPHEARWHNDNPKRMIGGFEALGAHLDAERGPYLLLDSGDFFQGAPEGTLSRGSSVVGLMNVARYDAVAIGNHEFDFGEDNLKRLNSLADFPLLAANIQAQRNGAPVSYARPWALFERGGVKVGVVGLATRFTSTSTLPAHVEHLHFVEEVAAARPHVEALRAAGAEVVIALTHCGVGPSVSRKRVRTADFQPTQADLHYPGDIQIAREAGVDLVLGGHAHAAFSELWRPEGGALIAQSGEHLEGFTKVTITIEPGAETPQIKGHLVPLWLDELPKASSTPEGEARAQGLRERLAAEVERVVSEVGAQMNVVIGEAADPLPRMVDTTSEGPAHLDGPLPNLFCDAMERVAEAELALHNTFGFRNDLPQGPLTVGHLYQVMPFDNNLAVMELTGAQIKAILSANLKGGVSRIQVSSSLTMKAQVSEGGEVRSVEINVKGEPLDEARRYKVAMNSYMSGGGSCCKALKALPSTDTAIPLRVLFMDVVREGSPLKAPATGRITSELIADKSPTAQPTAHPVKTTKTPIKESP